ncbi:MAG TPA: DUF4253 domain-containing protein [Micromonospora sp.]
MSVDPAVPAQLHALFPHGEVRGRVLPVALPPGRVVIAGGDHPRRPRYWVSDASSSPGLWSRLRDAHPGSGLWPLLLGVHDHGAWWAEPDDYDLDPMSSPGDHDPVALLAAWWDKNTQHDEDDMLTPAERSAVTAPYGRDWPGPAPALTPSAEPERTADRLADDLLDGYPDARLALVAAGSGAEALAVAGWDGPANHTGDTGKVAAVLRDWEERFGVRVVAAQGATLAVSVAAPPTDLDQALRVAAEHFAFCPDNIWQGDAPFTLAGYAERLVGAHFWGFWWD